MQEPKPTKLFGGGISALYIGSANRNYNTSWPRDTSPSFLASVPRRVGIARSTVGSRFFHRMFQISDMFERGFVFAPLPTCISKFFEVVVDTFAEARQRDVMNLAEELEMDFMSDRRRLQKLLGRINLLPDF